MNTALPLADVRILLVEDDLDTQFLTGLILKGAGAEVCGVDDGETALALMPDVKPDVLLSDIDMPVLDGFQLIGLVRELDDISLRTIPAVALSAFGGRHHFATALEHGFDMYIAKPVDPEGLIYAIASLLGARGHQRPDATG